MDIKEYNYFNALREAAIIDTKINNKKVIQEEGGDGELKKKLMDFFKSNPNPPDDAVHKFAEENNIDPHKLEGIIYSMLTMMIQNTPGKHKDVPDDKFDANEMAMGVEVEKEHTDCPMIAKEIAKDHLNEIPDYYTRLKKMEEEGKAAKGQGKVSECNKPMGESDSELEECNKPGFK
jgi:hypothetical protein